MYQTPVIRTHEEPLLVMDKRTIPETKSEILTKEILKNKLPLTLAGSEADILKKGKKEYMAFCSHCHGPNLNGQGTVGQSFFPLPTDLTSEKTAKISDQELFTFISYGGDKAPALASSMSIESRKAVIKYLRFKQKDNQ